MGLASGYNATVDRPTSIFTVDLVKKFPKAKVILTTGEDPSRWLSGLRVIKAMHDTSRWFPWSLLPFNTRFEAMAQEMWDSVGCSFRAGEIDEQRCLAYFQAHDEQVRREVPADRLLE